MERKYIIVNHQTNPECTSDYPATRTFAGTIEECAKKFKELYLSLTEEEKDILTDGAKIFVIKGEKVALVNGDTLNMKITYPYDLRVAKSLVEEEDA